MRSSASMYLTASTQLAYSKMYIDGLLVTGSGAASVLNVFQGDGAVPEGQKANIYVGADDTKPIMFDTPMLLENGIYIEFKTTIRSCTLLYHFPDDDPKYPDYHGL